MAFLVNATEEKEIVINNFEDITTEPISLENELIAEVMFFGCGSQGNSYYEGLVSGGMSHRDARTRRRGFVRDCRGGKWWGVSIFGVEIL